MSQAPSLFQQRSGKQSFRLNFRKLQRKVPFAWDSGLKLEIYFYNTGCIPTADSRLHEPCLLSKNKQLKVTDRTGSAEFLVLNRCIWHICERSYLKCFSRNAQVKKTQEQTRHGEAQQKSPVQRGLFFLPFCLIGTELWNSSTPRHMALMSSVLMNRVRLNTSQLSGHRL